MEALLAQHPAYDRQVANWLQQRALECWWRPGHPGWSIWPADSEQFIRGVVEAGDAILAPVQIIAPVPATPHASYAQSRLPLWTGPLALYKVGERWTGPSALYKVGERWTATMA